MSFSGRTPESVIPRSDSKNPSTTCRGITANGRPCRRALGLSSQEATPASASIGARGVLAILMNDDAAAFFCWQHKGQAENLVHRLDQDTRLYPLIEKSSLDTLIDRVGVINLDEEVSSPRRAPHRTKRRSDEHRSTRRGSATTDWQDVQSPLMTISQNFKQARPPQRPAERQYKHGQSNLRFSWACCLHAEDDGRDETKPHVSQHPGSTQRSYYQRQQMSYNPQALTSLSPRHQTPSPSANRTRPSPNVSTSQTQELLALIPKQLSPQTTSLLLTELCRPLSPQSEPGFIYIFWLTPESDTSPDDETASSLLDNVDDHSPLRNNRQQTALDRYASVRHASQPQGKRTILLKIGRAQNVHRRLSQWSKQCGQNITLIRYYPHNHSSATSSPKPVPFVARVERLIHLELSEMKAVKDKCKQCGREHTEWFEVTATKDGLKNIDSVVKRWVDWGLKQGHNSHATTLRGDSDNQKLQQRERKIHEKVWDTADRIRDDSWRDTGTAANKEDRANHRGGYY